MACITCRARKIKCDRTLPTCLNCRLRSSHCTYAGERRKRRWAKPGPDQGRPPILSHYHPPGNDRHSRSLEPSENRDARVSELVGRIDTQLDQNGDNTPEAGSTNSTSSAVFEPEESVGTQPSLPSSNMDCQPSVRIGGDAHEDYVETEDLLLDTILDKSVLQLPSVARLSLWMRTMNGDEYTGPSSGISTISDLGLKWIRQNVPDSETLCNSILEIRTSILAHLRQPKCVPLTLSSTPGSSPALKPIRLSDMAEYVDAYFTTTQTLLPILDRSQFEDQMRKYSTHTSGTMYSWNALLNAVLASGCRAALSDETAEAFQTSGREAWGYFQNAIYYESKMMNAPTDLLAVQAVAVMTIFAQGMSSPQRLEFTMSSAAARLAQSLGLNHRPPPEWEHSQQEQNERNRVFWVVYCLDKSIALRCGRPPVLNDHEISCAFPHGAESVLGGLGLAGKGHKVDVLLCVVKLARICGMVADKLYSASGLSLPASALQQAATKILNSLECWRTSLPTGIRPSKPIAKIRDLGHSSKLQLLVLHSTYYYVLCAIYRRFTPMFAQDGKDYRHLVSQATTVSHIEAARSIILLTKFFDIESFTPGWLIFYYPFTALTTVFSHIVANPTDKSARDDIALMEIVVGFFGRVEYITSGEAAFTKTTEFVRQARNVVARASDTATPPQRSGMSIAHDFTVDLGAELGVQRNEMLANGDLVLSENVLGDSVAGNLAPGSNLTQETGNGESHRATPPATLSQFNSAVNVDSEGILDEYWLQDWLMPTENVPIAP